MSTPTTPPKLTFSTHSSPQTPKRKRPIVDQFIDIIAEADRDEDTSNAIQQIRRVLLESDDLTPRKIAKIGVNTIQASSLTDLSDTADLLGLDYNSDEDHVWEEPLGPDINLSADARSLLERMRKARFWKRDSCEALSRTLIDIVVFDILDANQNDLAARAMSLRGEYPITTQLPGGTGIISGSADYVLGYDPVVASVPKRFESISIIMEAKKASESKSGFAQALAYMAGVQQRRMRLEPSRLIDTTYGIVSDGISWQFMKLNGKMLRKSKTFSMLFASDRPCIYRFVDAVIKSSISLSPHTTPERRFPGSSQRWQETTESRIFGTPTRQSQAGKSSVSEQSVEEFEIVRTGGEVELAPILPETPRLHGDN